MTRALTLLPLWLLMCASACGDAEAPVDLSGVTGDLASGVAGDLSGVIDSSFNADLLAPRTFRVNLIASDVNSFLLAVSYASSCARNFIGPCELVTCPVGTLDGWQTGDTRDHAGAISATSGTVSITIAPASAGSYGAATGGPLRMPPAAATSSMSTASATPAG